MQVELQASSGSVLLGDRFLCLKYCVTCCGSSASTDLAKVSLGALEEQNRKKEKRHTYWLVQKDDTENSLKNILSLKATNENICY